MDRRNDGQWKFLFAIFEWFVNCHQELLPSIEYGRFSAELSDLFGETIASVCRSSSSVRLLSSSNFPHSIRYNSRERKADPIWHFNPPQSYRLTDQDTTDFVNCLKDYAFISVFNKAHLSEAAKACQNLSQLRPEIIVPPLVELLFSSIDSITEPHRFTSILTCLAGMARQIVRQTPEFSQGQTYVLPLLMAVLPGIDSNDFKKTAVTFQFINSMLMLITCVDCSSAVTIRKDLTKVKTKLLFERPKMNAMLFD